MKRHWIILVIFFILACEPEPDEYQADFNIINQSGFSAEVILYVPKLEDSDTIRIENGGTYSITKLSEFEFRAPFWNDSIKIQFSNSKSKTYKITTKDARSPYEIDSYTEFKQGKYNSVFEYQLSPDNL